MIMAQEPAEDAQTSHVVIKVVDAEPTRSCCVCTEPLEWVAFGQCRHLDVCVGCAIRIRFFGNDQRCCICRTYCTNVIVTHVDSRLDDLPFFSSEDGVGRRYYWWYHAGMGAYFNDQNQYEMATKLCAKPPPRPDPETNLSEAETPVNQQLDDAPSQQPAAAGVVYRWHRDEPLSEARLALIFVGILLGVIMFLAAMCGMVFITSAETYYQKVAVVIAFGLLSTAATIYAIWCWPKFKATLLNC